MSPSYIAQIVKYKYSTNISILNAVILSMHTLFLDIIMSSYRDYDDDPYPRDSYPRKRTLAQDVFRDEFSARERVYRNELRPGPPPPGPDDSYYRRMDERDARELIGRGPPFGEPAFEPPLLSPKDSLLPLDHPLPFEELLPPGGERLGHEGRRFGSVIVFPPKVPRFPVDLNEPPSRTLYVGTLPRNTTKHHLEDLFSPFGQIEYIHLNNKFAHIQFELRDKNGLMRALDLDGSYINVGPSNSPEDYGPIVVQFSVRKQDSESESSQEHRPIELMRYTGINAANLASSLYKKSKFLVAAKSLKSWFDQGQCSSASANTFYTLLTSTNTCTRRAKKTLKDKGEELKSTLWKHKKELDDMKNDCESLIFSLFVINFRNYRSSPGRNIPGCFSAEVVGSFLQTPEKNDYAMVRKCHCKSF